MSWEQLRVGLLVLAALVVGGLALLFVGRTGNVFGERYRLVTLVESAAGLIPGSAVQLAGQTVGQVDRVELIPVERRPASGQAVSVVLAVDTRVRAQIRDDSRAQVRTQGLLGDKLIDISPGGADARILGPGDTLSAAEVIDYDALIAEGASAVGDLITVTRNLSELTSDVVAGEGTLGRLVTDEALYDRLVGVAASMDTLLAAAAEPDGPLMRMMTDDSLYRSMRRTVASLDTATARIVRGEGTVGRALTNDSLYDALLSTAARTDSLLARIEEGDGSLGRMLDDPRLYEAMLKSVVDLGSLLEAVREDPDTYVPEVKVF